MKTLPEEESTRGIMMSGDSPTPAPHGDHLYELKETSLISPPIGNSRSMLDKAVQFSPADFVNEPPVINSRPLHPSLALQELNPNLQQSSAVPNVKTNVVEKSPIGSQVATIDQVDDILSLPSRLEAKSKVTKPEEEIETVTDHTDNPSSMAKDIKPEQEDNCLVDCLYYVDQCCECTIL